MKTRLLKRISKELRIVKIRKFYYLQRKVYHNWVNVTKSLKYEDLIYYKHVEIALLLGKYGYANKILKKRSISL